MNRMNPSDWKNYGRKTYRAFKTRKYANEEANDYAGLNYYDNILTSSTVRTIELSLPIYLVYQAGTPNYPSGLATWPQFYSFDPAQLVQDYVITQNLNNDPGFPSTGYSREFRDMSLAWGLCRVKSICYSFVRTYTFNASVTNLPTMSSGVLTYTPSLFAPNDYNNSFCNYFNDGNMYYQVINTEKTVECKKLDIPLRTSTSPDGAGNIYNSYGWNPTEYAYNPWGFTAIIGQALPGVTTTTTSGSPIGTFFVKLEMEFAQPNIQPTV